MFSPRRTIGRKWWHWVAITALLGGSATVLIGEHQFATAAASPGATERVSLASDGSQSPGPFDGTEEPSISANGRYVAFSSFAPFDPVDKTNDGAIIGEQDVYVRDTVTQHTTLLSHSNTSANQPADGGSFAPSISGDGRFVAFVTRASNIVTGTSPMDVYVVVVDRDPKGTGTFDTDFAYTQVNETNGQGHDVGNPSLSADATRVAYEVESSGGDGPTFVGIRLQELHHGDHGELLTPSDTDITFPDDPLPLTVHSKFGDFAVGDVTTPELSKDGSHLLIIARYVSTADDDTFHPSITALFDFDVATKTATRLDLDDKGQPVSIGGGSDFIFRAALSGNGRLVAFSVEIGGDPLESEIRLVDRDPDGDGVFGPGTGHPITSAIESRDTAGAVASSDDPAFSADGRYLAFATEAAGTHNGIDDPTQRESCMHGSDNSSNNDVSFCDVVVRDLIVDRQRVAAGLPRLPAELASPSRLTTCKGFTPGATCEGGGDSFAPVLDADGSAIAYISRAPDLVANDTNRTEDIFERHFQPRLTGTPQDFGGLHLEDARTLAVPVSHSGFGPLSVTTATVTGANKADFTLVSPNTCTNALLHETDQCLISVHFKPGALGVRKATLTVHWRGGTDAVVEIPLSGTGTITPVPGFSVNPDPVNFGERPVTADSPPAVVTVTNTGTGPLTISAVNIFAGGGPAAFPTDYRITAQTCTGKPVAPAATCQVTIIQRPLGTGVRPAALSFTDDGLPAGPHLIPMNGSGAVPKLLASPAIAQPGRVSQISGTAFPPGQPVHVTLDAMPGTTTVITNGVGDFHTPLVILPHTFPGPRQLHATVTVTNGLPTPVTVTLTIPFLVVPGALEPPDFSVRN